MKTIKWSVWPHLFKGALSTLMLLFALHIPAKAQSSNDYAPEFSHDMKRVAFYSYRAGKGRIFIMNADGTNQSKISSGEGNHIEPIWSPNDESISYASTLNGVTNIYRVYPKTQKTIQLTSFESGLASPEKWFSHGKIYFRRDPHTDDNPEEELWVMNEDGSNQTKLMSFPKGQFGLDIDGKEKKVYFSTRDDEGKQDIFSSNLDGSSMQRLTQEAGNTGSVKVSPDNSKILFTANSSGNEELYIMKKSGKDVKRLTFTDQNEYFMSFSPDGRSILFDSERNGAADIWQMNLEGKSLQNLTDNSTLNRFSSVASGKMAFISQRDGNAEVYLSNEDGSDIQRITNTIDSEDHPVLSPDGSKIVYISNRDGNDEVYLYDVASGTETRLTENPATDLEPAFASNGKKVVFASTRDGNVEIYSIDLDGKELKRLTENDNYDASPIGTVNGKIAWHTNRDGNFEVYIMNEDGSGKKNITNNQTADLYPSFSPNGELITFNTNRYEKQGTHIAIMNIDGKNVTRVTFGDNSKKWNPTFNSDGSKIIFESNNSSDFNYHLFSVALDSNTEKQITYHEKK